HPDHRDVFDYPAIHGRQHETAATLEDAVADGDIPESPVRLRAELDAAGAVPVTGLPEIHKGLEAAVEQRAELIAASDVAIGDHDVLGRARISEGKRALGADRIVPG